MIGIDRQAMLAILVHELVRCYGQGEHPRAHVIKLVKRTVQTSGLPYDSVIIAMDLED